MYVCVCVGKNWHVVFFTCSQLQFLELFSVSCGTLFVDLRKISFGGLFFWCGQALACFDLLVGMHTHIAINVGLDVHVHVYV